MNQMDLWEKVPTVKKEEQVIWFLFIDGACKNNPGPSALGFVLKRNQEIVCQQGFYLGQKTNNQAEYFGLIVGIFFAKKYIQKDDQLIIISDSQLLVRQMNGIYKVKDAALRQLKDLAVVWLRDYCYKIEHVLREFNTSADAMANYGIDKKISLPKEVLQSLQHHDIFI